MQGDLFWIQVRDFQTLSHQNSETPPEPLSTLSAGKILVFVTHAGGQICHIWTHFQHIAESLKTLQILHTAAVIDRWVCAGRRRDDNLYCQNDAADAAMSTWHN